MLLSCHSVAAIVLRKENFNSLLGGLHRGPRTLAPAEARWGARLLVTRKPATAAFKRSPGDDAFLTGFEGTFKSPAFLFARCIHRAPGLQPPPRAREGEPRVGKPGARSVGGGVGVGENRGERRGWRTLGRRALWEGGVQGALWGRRLERRGGNPGVGRGWGEPGHRPAPENASYGSRLPPGCAQGRGSARRRPLPPCLSSLSSSSSRGDRNNSAEGGESNSRHLRRN